MQITQVTTAKTLSFGKTIAIGAIFFIVGALVTAWGVISNITHAQKSAIFTETTAEVVDYRQNSDGLYAIIAEYEVDGEIYTKSADDYSNIPAAIGSTVMIKYNPANPKEAIWSVDPGNIFIPIIGGAFATLGGIIILYAIKNKDKIKATTNSPANSQPTPTETQQPNNPFLQSPTTTSGATQDIQLSPQASPLPQESQTTPEPITTASLTQNQQPTQQLTPAQPTVAQPTMPQSASQQPPSFPNSPA